MFVQKLAFELKRDLGNAHSSFQDFIAQTFFQQVNFFLKENNNYCKNPKDNGCLKPPSDCLP